MASSLRQGAAKLGVAGMLPAKAPVGVDARARLPGRMAPGDAQGVDLSADGQAVGPAHGHDFHGIASVWFPSASIVIRWMGPAIQCRVG